MISASLMSKSALRWEKLEGKNESGRKTWGHSLSNQLPLQRRETTTGASKQPTKSLFLGVLFCDFSFPSVINEKAEMTGSLSCLIFICRITRWGCKVRSRKAEAGFIFQFRHKRPAENKLHPV